MQHQIPQVYSKTISSQLLEIISPALDINFSKEYKLFFKYLDSVLFVNL